MGGADQGERRQRGIIVTGCIDFGFTRYRHLSAESAIADWRRGRTRNLPTLRVHRSFVNGFGNDASVINIGIPDKSLIFKIDRAATPIATVRGWSDYRLWGRVAVTSTCSDILAGGGNPVAVMISLVLPGSWDQKAATQIVIGCEEECNRWDVAFVGGDTKEGRCEQVVGAAVGLVENNRILSRKASEVGDNIVIAGALGGYIGSYLFLSSADTTISEDARQQYLSYVVYPTARWIEARQINRLGGPKVAMDTSDGLYDALQSISFGTLGIEIELASLPFHEVAIAAQSGSTYRS